MIFENLALNYKNRKYFERLKSIDLKIMNYKAVTELLSQNEQYNNFSENSFQIGFDTNRKKKPNLITFFNTYSYYKLFDSDCNLDRFHVFLLDGKLQVILHNVFHKNKVKRASFDFSSIAHEFFEYSQSKNLRIVLIGASAEEIVIAVKNLHKKYPSLKIVYSRDGYFQSESEKQSLCGILKEKNPDVIILGMGAPAQEEYAIYLHDNGLLCTVITCGGFFTQTSLKTDYYNPIIKKTGLRWLQRLIQFKHVRRRLLIDYPKNIIRYLMEHIWTQVIKI